MTGKNMLEYKMNINGELVSGFLAYVYVVKELGYDIKPLEEYDEVGFIVQKIITKI